MTTSSSSGLNLSALAGASSAALTSVASSICCIGPLAITLLGVNGAILGAAIKPYRPILLTAAAVLLAFAYWRLMSSRNGAAVDAYDAMFGIEGRPCAGVFMLYRADTVWEGNSPPMPEYFKDAHAREFSRTAGPQFDGRRLAKRARQMLDEKV